MELNKELTEAHFKHKIEIFENPQDNNQRPAKCKQLVHQSNHLDQYQYPTDADHNGINMRTKFIHRK